MEHFDTMPFHDGFMRQSNWGDKLSSYFGHCQFDLIAQVFCERHPAWVYWNGHTP